MPRLLWSDSLTETPANLLLQQRWIYRISLQARPTAISCLHSKTTSSVWVYSAMRIAVSPSPNTTPRSPTMREQSSSQASVNQLAPKCGGLTFNLHGTRATLHHWHAMLRLCRHTSRTSSLMMMRIPYSNTSNRHLHPCRHTSPLYLLQCTRSYLLRSMRRQCALRLEPPSCARLSTIGRRMNCHRLEH